MQFWISWWLMLVVVGLTGCANATGPGSSDDELLGPPPSLCDMIGDGTLANGDSFAGNVTINPGGFASGTWDHHIPIVGQGDAGGPPGHCGRRGGGHARGHDDGRPGTRTGHERHHASCGAASLGTIHFQGVVFNGDCTRNGDDTVNFTGSGVWDGIANYTFAGFARDGNGSGPDFYDITITAPDGTEQYHAGGDLASGSITIP